MALFVLHTILRDFAASIAVSILLLWTISSPKIEGKQILDFQLHVDWDNEINFPLLCPISKWDFQQKKKLDFSLLTKKKLDFSMAKWMETL